MTRLIKKYKNRRLYDMEKSQYITIDELKHYVLDGLSFRVEDSETGEDITNTVFLQILVESETASTQFLSPDMLRHLIYLAHHPLSQSFKAILEQTMDLMEKQMLSNPYFNDYQRTADSWNKQFQQFLRNLGI